MCKACRGLSLEDSYWIRQDGDEKTWEEVNLFHNPLSLFVTEISLSGRNVHYFGTAEEKRNIHTPELTTSEETSLVTFEEFQIFCSYYGMNPYEEARAIDHTFYLKMQIADYLLNNTDRHEQNWGFLMENSTGKIIGFCPLFDHDHAFSSYDNVMSQTTETEMTLRDAVIERQRQLLL